MLTLGVHVLDPEATQLGLLKAARSTTNATSYMARFLPDLQERKADWDIVLKAMDDGQHLVDLVHQVALLRPRAHHPRRAGRAVDFPGARVRGSPTTP
jgi:conjugal transfer ATP-binding protein TraC